MSSGKADAALRQSTLRQQGFAYCYDKRLYDRLRNDHAGPIRGHLLAGLDYQEKPARFLENHDEPRAAAEFAWPQQRGGGSRPIFAAARSSRPIPRSPSFMRSYCKF